MEPNLIALAIPAFFALIGLELWVAGRRRGDLYRFQDAITDLSCGIGSQVTGVFFKGGMLALYVLVYELAAVVELSASSWVTWVLAAVVYDHQYYWWHRAGHRINFIWAAHVVHHQSEDYNLAVALRQAWFAIFTGTLFYLPLAVLGVPPLVYAIVSAVNTLYQFWIHTRLVGKLGPLEWVINTPSHHRVHHAINPKYIDKNYAGMFIVWDRLYGTFIEEDEEPVYGTVARLESWDPVWSNFKTWKDILDEARACSRWSDKLKVWFAPPEWAPAELGGNKVIPEVSARTYRKFQTPTHGPTNVYVGLQFVVVTLGVVGMLWVEHTAGLPELAVLGTLIVWSTWNWGALFERRPIARRSEAVRLLATVVAAAAFHSQGVLPLSAVGIAAGYLAVSLGALLWARSPALDGSTTDAEADEVLRSGA